MEISEYLIPLVSDKGTGAWKQGTLGLICPSY
jgi:hypothetical protein